MKVDDFIQIIDYLFVLALLSCARRHQILVFELGLLLLGKKILVLGLYIEDTLLHLNHQLSVLVYSKFILLDMIV